MNAVALFQARIEDWALTFPGGKPRLHGKAFGHPSPEIRDGEPVVTSEVQNIDFAAGTATTRNTTYTLGKRAEG